MDRATAVRGGDEALIARAASAALARVAARRAPRREQPPARGKRWIAALRSRLFVFSASGVAAALWSGSSSWPFATAASDHAERAGSGRVRAAKAARGSREA